ncbi:MAG: hypothetical protein ACI9GW_003374 [Halieaceae bacterium]|jgi:hypothetical protein
MISRRQTAIVNRVLLLAPLLVFGIAGSWFLALFLDPGNRGPIHDNLVPELIGFCLEGFFLIGLFSLIQRRQDRERREELWQSLRGALRELLSYLDIGLLSEAAEPADSLALEQDPAIVQQLRQKLADQELDLDAMSTIKSVASRNLATIHDLIPVAAQLSAAHMRWWLAISDSVRMITEAKDKESVKYSLNHFLANLGEFDSQDI